MTRTVEGVEKMRAHLEASMAAGKAAGGVEQEIRMLKQAVARAKFNPTVLRDILSMVTPGSVGVPASLSWHLILSQIWV